MANSEQLRKKLGALRAGVTRALALLTNLLQQPDPDASQISGHMDYLKNKETALSQLDDVVLATTDEENLDQEVGTAQEYNERILYAVSRAKFWLQERERNAGTQARATEPGPSYLGSPNSGDAAGQIGYFICEHHDEDRILEILHAEYIVVTHVKNALYAIRVGPKDGKGCDSRKSMTALVDMKYPSEES
ncbi:hypothetical protein HPB52_004737 [Rhipicephalus sanguineus]|uniref:Uncharacterized protein n=1 Tax=Rhipicephalus sanguineus TaxID=34632 RepID=A0A9D4PRG1_RHISA|nr:hypothetical protein HPB52_004737 [Rhipicephalus sanguineus]